MKKPGFTIIELSIVLVIISLVVAGILVGQELIHASQIRATIRQAEHLDRGLSTFRLKYGCLPGDCINASALGFAGYAPTDNLTLPANGNGDGRIDHPALREPLNAINILYQAGYIQELQFGSSHTPLLYPKINASSISGARGGWYIQHIGPPTAGNVPLVTQPGHYLWLSGQAGNGARVHPLDAYNIDSKMDDGLPLSGNVYGDTEANMFDINGVAVPSFDVSFTGSGWCLTADSPPRYNVMLADADRASGLCIMVIRASQ